MGSMVSLHDLLQVWRNLFQSSLTTILMTGDQVILGSKTGILLLDIAHRSCWIQQLKVVPSAILPSARPASTVRHLAQSTPLTFPLINLLEDLPP